MRDIHVDNPPDRRFKRPKRSPAAAIARGRPSSAGGTRIGNPGDSKALEEDVLFACSHDGDGRADNCMICSVVLIFLFQNQQITDFVPLFRILLIHR